MLSAQQTDMMALLNSFNCVRYSHLKKHMAAKHESTEEHLSKMLNQLVFLGEVMVTEGLVMLPGREADAGILRALDIVMNLTDGGVDCIKPGKEPFILTFSIIQKKDGEITSNKFGIVMVDTHSEKEICERLSTIVRDLTVIFIISELRQREYLKIENKSYFAILEEGGKYKFYKSANRTVK